MKNTKKGHGMVTYWVKRVAWAITTLLLAIFLIFWIFESVPGDPSKVILGKPAIYLYPQEPTLVDLRVELTQGQMTVTDPPMGEGWQVVAQPDGTLRTADGQEYPYLFWEADSAAAFDFSKGFVVPRDEVEGFLAEKLPYLGLNAVETADCMEFWVPAMSEAPYYKIAFQQQEYTQLAQLEVSPQPDSVLRVFMACKPLTQPQEIPPQVLQPGQRQGFALVEWGGSICP